MLSRIAISRIADAFMREHGIEPDVNEWIHSPDAPEDDVLRIIVGGVIFEITRCEEDTKKDVRSYLNHLPKLIKTEWDNGSTLYRALHNVGDDPVKKAISHDLEVIFRDKPEILKIIAQVFVTNVAVEQLL